MLRVALTGSMASGKSSAAAIFRELGCFVSQSDEVARAMMQPGEIVYDSIVSRLGPSVVLANGFLDRAALARIAFAEGRAEDLNSIIHPAVIASQSEWMRSVGEQDPSAIAIIESALIFETKHGAATDEQSPWRARFDRILLVIAPEQVRIDRAVQRYIARAGTSSSAARDAVEADARARMREQMPDEEKVALSDVVIENYGSIDDLRSRVTEVWHQLRDEAVHRCS